MATIKRLILKEEEKELLKKVAHLFWDKGETDSENDIAANTFGLCNIVTSFEELGDLIISVVDSADNEE